MNSRGTEDFRGNETVLYDTTMANTCYYIVVLTHRTYHIKSEPQGKLCTLGDTDINDVNNDV